MSLEITGIGSAVPDHAITQTEAATLALDLANAAPGRERALAAIYRKSGVRTRGSVLLENPGGRPFAQEFFPPAEATAPGGPSTGERMARYALEAGRLGVEAAARALAAAGVEPGAVTHLVTCSCTGFASPGLDIEAIEDLGLEPTVARTHVGFMGCHGAFNALRVADAFAATDSGAVVLVICVELCSLHFQYGGQDDHVVANSLFADGAAATEMTWLIADSGFEMRLSPRVPDLIATHLLPTVAAMLAEAGLAIADVATWAVHPGGPRILSAVETALGLPAEALAVSRSVLAEHGNMSSGTILFILERLRATAAGGPCVAMAFGPGLSVELAVLER